AGRRAARLRVSADPIRSELVEGPPPRERAFSFLVAGGSHGSPTHSPAIAGASLRGGCSGLGGRPVRGRRGDRVELRRRGRGAHRPRLAARPPPGGLHPGYGPPAAGDLRGDGAGAAPLWHPDRDVLSRARRGGSAREREGLLLLSPQRGGAQGVLRDP